MKTCIYIIVLLFTTVSVFSQTDNLSKSKLKELAESAELNGDIYNAIYFYEGYYKIKPSYKISRKLADLNFKTKDYEQALNFYANLIKKDASNANINFKIGQCYKNLGQYDSCLVYFDKINKKQLSSIEKKNLRFAIEGATFALKNPPDTSIVTVTRLNKIINKGHMESAPFFINDSLIIFSSQIISDSNLYYYQDTNKLPQRKFYYAEKLNDEWTILKKEPSLNSKFQIIDNAYLSLDKKRFYFSATEKNWHNKNISNLYVSDYSTGNFGKALLLDNAINSPFFNSSQPAIGNTYNQNLEIVYFSSDMPGGKGGKDIWYTIFNKKTGYYKAPINAGKRINTSNDEITPYYDYTTKTLYFSSNGHTGYGGFDIFKSTGELKSWRNPINIGNYLNTYADEVYFRLNQARSAGFIASNRSEENNFCCYDLFYFTFKDPNHLSLSGKLSTKMNPIIEQILAKGVAFRDSSIAMNKALRNTVVSLYLRTEEGQDSLYILSDTTNAEGLYGFNVEEEEEYILVVHDGNEIKTQATVSTKDLGANRNVDIVVDFEPISTLPKSALIIKNIYYETGKSELSTMAQNRLDSTLIFLMKNMKDVIIEVSSHTDNVGSDKFNQKLSEDRARKVSDYLVKSGISKKRIVAKGYGETEPIWPNDNPDGTPNEEGRKNNRRTEFKIIGTKSSIKL